MNAENNKLMNAELEIVAKPETKLAIAHLKMVEILTALDPTLRNKKLRNGFDKVRIEAESIADVAWALDKMADDLLRDIYRLIDLLTVELASTSMIADAVKEVDEPTSEANSPTQRQKEQTPGPR